MYHAETERDRRAGAFLYSFVLRVNEKNRKRPPKPVKKRRKYISRARYKFSFTFLSSLFKHKHAPARNKTKQNKTIKAFVKTCNSYAIRVLRSYSLYSNIKSKRAACFERRIFFCFSKERRERRWLFFLHFFFFCGLDLPVMR